MDRQSRLCRIAFAGRLQAFGNPGGHPLVGQNVDIGNAWLETEAARGSVSYVDFDVVKTRRVMVAVKDADNKILPYGASVFDVNDNFVTVVGDKGSVFIPDAGASKLFNVQVSGRKLCSFVLTLPEEAQKNDLYETASSLCSK